MPDKITIASLSRNITTEAEAYSYFESLRWSETPICAHCGGSDVYLITPTNGSSRKTRTGSLSERRVWNCRPCRKQFSVLTGTVMHGTKISVRIWLMVVFEMCASKNGISAREVERKYGVAGRSAWFMCHRIREAMSSNDGSLFSGDIVVDETYLGGDPRFRHARDPRLAARGRGTEKTAVVSLINAATGEVRSRVVPTVSGFTLRTYITGNVDLPMSTLHTDSLPGYKGIGTRMAGHHVVNHAAGEYVTEKSHGTNKAENYFSQLKRSLDGTFHHVSREHLGRYLAEFDFRFSSRDMTDAERMNLLVKQAAGRLTYKVAKTSTAPDRRPQQERLFPRS